ncbi:MAG: PIN domain-containing protein [Planctomycetota bacterium]
MPSTDLVTSCYALEEARRNLVEKGRAGEKRLERLIAKMEVVPDIEDPLPLPAEVSLPPKDRPILEAAMSAHCSQLLTGDVRHFGTLLGTAVGGGIALRPAEYLQARGAD